VFCSEGHRLRDAGKHWANCAGIDGLLYKFSSAGGRVLSIDYFMNTRFPHGQGEGNVRKINRNDPLAETGRQSLS
jgi:hypothetical protein